MLRKAVRLMAILAVCTATAVVGYGVRADRPEPPTGTVDLAPNPGHDLDPGPVPVPQPLPATPLLGQGEIQLVGFTSRAFPGNKGVLNYTLACQARFPGSRMCTLEDVRQTVHVPRVPGNAFAWVRNEGRMNPTATREADVGPDGENRFDLAANDCSGWISRSPQDFGTAMDIGPESACYGGFWATSCDQELAVACCARMP